MNWFGTTCALRREDLCLLGSGALPDHEQTELEAHLAACDECRRYYRQIQNAAAPFANWEKNFISVQPNPNTRQRWEKAIHAAAAEPRVPLPARENVLTVLWRELIWRPRGIWAGFGVAWLVIVAANLADPDVSHGTVAQAQPMFDNLSIAWAQQQKLMAELTDSPESHDADKPKSTRPRSQRQSEWQTG